MAVSPVSAHLESYLPVVLIVPVIAVVTPALIHLVLVKTEQSKFVVACVIPPYVLPCVCSIPSFLHCVAVASAHVPSADDFLPVLAVFANVLGILAAAESLHVVEVNAVHVQSRAVFLAQPAPIGLAYKSVPSIQSVAASTAHD